MTIEYETSAEFTGNADILRELGAIADTTERLVCRDIGAETYAHVQLFLSLRTELEASLTEEQRRYQDEMIQRNIPRGSLANLGFTADEEEILENLLARADRASPEEEAYAQSLSRYTELTARLLEDKLPEYQVDAIERTALVLTRCVAAAPDSQTYLRLAYGIQQDGVFEVKTTEVRYLKDVSAKFGMRSEVRRISPGESTQYDIDVDALAARILRSLQDIRMIIALDADR